MFTSNFVHVNTTVPLISALVKEKYARKKERRRKNSTKAYCLLIRKEMTNGASLHGRDIVIKLSRNVFVTSQLIKTCMFLCNIARTH